MVRPVDKIPPPPPREPMPSSQLTLSEMHARAAVIKLTERIADMEASTKLLRFALERIVLMWPQTSGPVSDSFRQVARDALGPSCPDCGRALVLREACYTCLNCGTKTGVGPGKILPGMALADAARAIHEQMPERAEALIAALEREMSLAPKIWEILAAIPDDARTQPDPDRGDLYYIALDKVRKLLSPYYVATGAERLPYCLLCDHTPCLSEIAHNGTGPRFQHPR